MVEQNPKNIERVVYKYKNKSYTAEELQALSEGEFRAITPRIGTCRHYVSQENEARVFGGVRVCIHSYSHIINTTNRDGANSAQVKADVLASIKRDLQGPNCGQHG